MENTIRIPLEPQPPKGIKVSMITSNRGLDGCAFYHHAMTEEMGHDTIFYHCPLGLPDDLFSACAVEAEGSPLEVILKITDLNVDCVEGIWCWVIDCDSSLHPPKS